MNTETVLTDEQKAQFVTDITEYGTDFVAPLLAVVESIEQAVLQSEQVRAWKKDAERLDWLADPNNSIGNVQLPAQCIRDHLDSMRAAIDVAMRRWPAK